MQAGGERDWGDVRWAMHSDLYVVNRGECGDLHHRGDSATVRYGHTKVVDELLGYQCRAIMYRIEDFSDSEWGGGALADGSKAFLKLPWDGVFQPEKLVGL